jgi:hypothetical protein
MTSVKVERIWILGSNKAEVDGKFPAAKFQGIRYTGNLYLSIRWRCVKVSLAGLKTKYIQWISSDRLLCEINYYAFRPSTRTGENRTTLYLANKDAIIHGLLLFGVVHSYYSVFFEHQQTKKFIQDNKCYYSRLSQHHVTRHNTSIHNILSTATQLSISQKALGKLPEDGNVMPKHVGATIHN